MRYPKVALITGGAGGIGGAITERLAEDGFSVVLNYNKSEKQAKKIARKLRQQGKHCLPIKADITNETAVTKMIKKTIATFKSLDVLVNNAGINRTQSFEEMTWPDYEELLDTNLRGAIIVTKQALPYLNKSKTAKIIFIASDNAFIGSSRRLAYVVSKSGILGLVKALTLELSPNILVNGIAPGYIETRMTKFSKNELKEKLKKIPLKRLGKPEEVASLVSFLVSDDNTYMTGQVIHINGGLFLS